MPISTGTNYRFGAFEVDAASGELLKLGARIKLQEQPFRLLVILLENAGHIVSREEIQNRIWDKNTFVDFDSGLRVAVRKLREALGDDAENPRYIETIPKRGYRFLSPASKSGDSTPSIAFAESSPAVAELPETALASSKSGKWFLVGAILLFLVVAAGTLRFFSRTPRILTEKDTLVLAEFTNSTGDPVFDGTLRQGLAVELEQSPFLRIIPTPQIQQTLQMMGQDRGSKITPELAQQLCQRTASAAVLDGSIAQIGARYLLTLRAVNCVNGGTLVSTEAQAGDKNQVLNALGRTASQMRNKLGESLSTIQRFDTPLEQATTPSLEALKAFTSGAKIFGTDGFSAAVPFFNRAIQLDPNFAMAYYALGLGYWSIHEDNLGSENMRKAFELRERVSDNEKLAIEAEYYFTTTGNMEKSRQASELWVQTYLRDTNAHRALGFAYSALGQFDKALPESLEVLRLDPNRGQPYSNVAIVYIRLNRFQEARAILEEAEKKRLDYPALRHRRYILAFLQNDSAGMAREVASISDKPGDENLFLAYMSDTAAYSGQLAKARALSNRAITTAERAEEKEAAANHAASAALREALFGNTAEARQRAAAALALSRGRDVVYAAALALAIAGDSPEAQSIADDLNERFPEDTQVQFNYVPSLRAQLALRNNDPARGIELLQAAIPYEQADMGAAKLFPAFVRGEAYLAAHQGLQANVEFQKIIDRPGQVVNEPIGALAHLQQARALAASGDNAAAKSAYQSFLSLWKDADPNVPIFKQAKTEYAKLE